MRAEVGSPPLAAPIGQIVASQALLNVLTANRYSTMVDELRDLVNGGFGRTPGPVDPALVRAVEHFGDDGSNEPVDLDELRDERRRRRGERGGAAAARALRRRGRAAAARDPRALRRRRVARRGRRRPGATGAHPRGGAHRPGDGSGRDHDRRGRDARQRAPDGRPALPAGRTGRRRPSDRGQPAARAAARRHARACREPDGRHVLPRACSGLGAVRGGGRRRRARPDALHPRGDEADERGQGRGRGRVRAIHVGNAEPVEYGQLLFELEPVNGRPLDAV